RDRTGKGLGRRGGRPALRCLHPPPVLARPDPAGPSARHRARRRRGVTRMPLPQPNQAWPPQPLAPIRAKLEEWDAWYQGDPTVLTKVYTGRLATAPRVRPSQQSGGIVGALSR